MSVVGNIKYELEGRFAESGIGKSHLSVRYESGARVARVGACLDDYTWESRKSAIAIMTQFERDHATEFAVEFDIVPLGAVNDEAFADA